MMLIVPSDPGLPPANLEGYSRQPCVHEWGPKKLDSRAASRLQEETSYQGHD